MEFRRGLTGLAAMLTLATSSPAADPRGIVVEVAAGKHDRRDTPVVLALPDSLKASRAFRLVHLDTLRLEPVQIATCGDPSVCWIVRDPLPAGATRRFRLDPAPVVGEPRVICDDDGKRLMLKVGERPVLQYNLAVVEPPEAIDPIYGRSGWIHPLFTPAGLIVTDDFPPDHPHQHGLFFAWVNTTFEGRRIDFWNQKARTGRVGHAEILETRSGPVFGLFAVRLRHEDVTAPGAPRPVLDEVWIVRAYDLLDHFLIDFESRQTCAGSHPLTIQKYHYGGFGLRGSRSWHDPEVKGDDPPDPARSGGSDFLTSEGKGRRDGNHTRPHWVGLSGKIGEKSAGVAILDGPENFRSPQPVRLHPNKPYFCFAPMVAGEFEIEPGKPYVSRYRLDVRDGPLDVDAVERLWDDYADPPRVRIVAE